MRRTRRLAPSCPSVRTAVSVRPQSANPSEAGTRSTPSRGVVVPKCSQPALDDYLRRVVLGESSVGELLPTDTAIIELLRDRARTRQLNDATARSIA